MAEIREDNVSLERLTAQTRIIDTIKKSRKLPDFEGIRTNASSVFSGLQKALHMSCSEPHKVSVYLGSSVESSRVNEMTAGLQGHTLRVVLHHELPNSKQKVVRWSVEEADIKLIETTPLISAATDSNTTAAISSLKPAKPRTVKFAEPKPEPKAVPGTSSVPPVIKQQSIAEIHDLCRDIADMRTTECGNCLGYMVAGQYRHGLYSPAIRLIDRPSLSIQTLAAILDNKQRSKSLTGADARRLAVPLV